MGSRTQGHGPLDAVIITRGAVEYLLNPTPTVRFFSVVLGQGRVWSSHLIKLYAESDLCSRPLIPPFAAPAGAYIMPATRITIE
jgi:hypothetical protein